MGCSTSKGPPPGLTDVHNTERRAARLELEPTDDSQSSKEESETETICDLRREIARLKTQMAEKTTASAASSGLGVSQLMSPSPEDSPVTDRAADTRKSHPKKDYQMAESMTSMDTVIIGGDNSSIEIGSDDGMDPISPQKDISHFIKSDGSHDGDELPLETRKLLERQSLRLESLVNENKALRTEVSELENDTIVLMKVVVQLQDAIEDMELERDEIEEEMFEIQSDDSEGEPVPSGIGIGIEAESPKKQIIMTKPKMSDGRSTSLRFAGERHTGERRHVGYGGVVVGTDASGKLSRSTSARCLRRKASASDSFSAMRTHLSSRTQTKFNDVLAKSEMLGLLQDGDESEEESDTAIVTLADVVKADKRKAKPVTGAMLGKPAMFMTSLPSAAETDDGFEYDE